MPTEELKFEELLKEYIEVVESTNITKLEEENKVIKVDIERKKREEKNVDIRIEEIQAELESLDESSIVEIEDKEFKLEEAEDFKEKKQKEIKKLERKEKENNRKIRKANNIGEDVIKRAEEKTNKENEELEKKIEELKARKEKYGIKRKDKDGNEDIQLTPEEKMVIDSIDNDIKKLNKEIRDNKKAFLLFKKTIEEAKKDKEVFLALKDKVKGKEEPKKEEPKEKPEQKNNEQKSEKTDEKPEKTDNIKHEDIPVTPTSKTEKKKDEEEPVQKPTGEGEEKEENSDKPSREGKVEHKGKVIPGVPQPEYEIHEVKDPEENKDIYSNSYEKALDEYKMSLEMYNQDLETLYNLQQQYENGEIEYSEYEKHADYMVERYRFIKEEYNKVKGQYETEKGKETNSGKTNKLQWHPDLTQEQIDYIKSELEIYEPVGQEYEQALKQLGLDPDKQPIVEENQTPQWHPDLTQEQIDWLISEKEIYEPIGQEYEQALRELGLDPNKQIKNRDKDIEEPEKPEQPMMILEKEKGDTPPGKNLPVRSFWEIYSETNTEHASNLAIKLHNFAHMKLLPRKEEDTATKVLSGILLPIKLFAKLGAIIPNKLLRTDKKLEEMQENIDELSPEEFQILVSSSDKVNEMFGDAVKDSFDKEYLDPQFMKQYKVNELYLKAVGGRLTRERQAGIEYCNEQIVEYDGRLKELERISKDRELTPDEILEYNELTQAKQELTQQGKDLRGEIDTFNDGVKKKSSAFKNIRGWFLGRFNPDNREENAKMAQMSRERREASQRGDISEVSRKTNEMQDFAKQQTVIRGIKNDKIDRGKYSIEGPIEMLDRGEENRGRLLLTNAAAIAAAVDLVQQITNARNMQVTRDVQVSGEAKVSELEGAKEAQEGIARQTVEGTFNRNERANLDANDWRLGSSGYKAGDAITHAEGGQAAKAVQDAIARGDSEGALRIATEYFQRNAAKDEAAMGAYAQANPQFDYTAVNFGGAKDAQAIMDFFGGTVKFSDTVRVTIDGIKTGINPLAAIFAGANAIHQAQKQGVKDGFKEALRKEAKKKVKDKETDEKENEEKTTQENPSKENER